MPVIRPPIDASRQQLHMKKRSIFILSVLAVLLLAGNVWSAPKALQRELKARIAQMQAQERFVCRSELICGVSDLPRFYRRNRYRPVWIDNAKASHRVNDLLAAISSSRQHGLRPADYHFRAIASIVKYANGRARRGASVDVATLADLELLCTDAYMLLGSHLLAGRVNPETLYAKWLVSDPRSDFAILLQKAVDQDRIEESLRQQLPPHSGYTALKKQLARYRRLAATHKWKPIPAGGLIRKGNRDRRVPLIRKRLRLLGDLPASASGNSNRLDRSTFWAIARFQKRHGLKPDGIVGERTLAALNVTPARRIGQIKLNLERWRWIPHDLGSRHLMINIADYSLVVVEKELPVMRMRVVVGNSYRRTPVFSDAVKTIEINPYWNVPTRLAVDDLLPRIQKDPGYLARNDFSVFAGWKKGAREIDPATIDWSTVTADNFWYKFRQNPGPKNALGRMKFLFPNQFAVYLHDTPSRRIFLQNQRGFSSGCIRVEKPIELAEFLLEGRKGWNRRQILAAVDTGRRTKVRLKGDVAIHIMYWTAWVDREGVLQFREDIYQRDKPLAAALRAKRPRLLAASL